MSQIKSITGFTAMALLLGSLAMAQSIPDQQLYRALDSGGPLIREQAAYDVLFYRLNVTMDTTAKSIVASAYVRALTLDTLSIFVLDLTSKLTVDSITWKGRQSYGATLSFSRPTDRIWIKLPFVVQKADTVSITIAYHGTPKISTNPPWDEGFVWKRTRTGEVWAGVACEEGGADLWWPCKDHPSDEPDSVDLNFTVPSHLMCVSNGTLRGTIDNGNGTKTYRWYVTQTINNYNVTFYLGPYVKIPVDYTSIAGAKIPAEYWFLPYNVDSVKNIMPTWLKDIRFLEETCGPYPFRAEKYCIVDAPYAGMEHQTCVAYGVYGSYHFNANYAGYGFDYIHLHEMAHEWWGNLVTAKDWSDVWIHEGFATYMEALFVERTLGFSRYMAYMSRLRSPIRNTSPVAPRSPSTAAMMFSSNDVYYKGAWILHTLRHYVGDQAFFSLLHRLTYPDPAMESVTNGKQCWLATTDDYLRIAEQQTGVKLDWFFEVYLRQAALPRLQATKQDTVLKLQWVTPNGLPFSLPVDVRVGTDTIKVAMKDGTGSVKVPAGQSFQIDPNSWILLSPAQVVNVSGELVPREFAISVYPNPFNPTTTLQIEVPRRMQVRGEIYSIAGQKTGEVVNSWLEAGTHAMTIDLENQSSGVYLVVVRGEGKKLTTKIVLVR